MYHNISGDGRKDNLIVAAEDFEKQLQYLRDNHYNTIALHELTDSIKGKGELPANPVLLTFDDGYQDNYTVMYPLLKKYNMKACIFLVSSFVQKHKATGSDIKKKHLSVDEIKSMDPAVIEFGLHTYDHKSYGGLTNAEQEQDIIMTMQQLISLGVAFQPALAYTFGNYPKRNIFKQLALFKMLRRNHIDVAFRIGNRVNKLPLRNTFLIQRIDVKGNLSFNEFVRLFLKGKRAFK